MLYYIIIYYIILYYIILYFIIIYYIIFFILFYYIILYYIILYHIVLYYIINHKINPTVTGVENHLRQFRPAPAGARPWNWTVAMPAGRRRSCDSSGGLRSNSETWCECFFFLFFIIFHDFS